jgi:hypothetical protein
MLGWTVAQAYSILPPPRRQGPGSALLRLLTGVWNVPRLLIYVPVVAAELAAGRLARLDRHAVVTLAPDGGLDRRGLAALIGTLAALVAMVLTFIVLVPVSWNRWIAALAVGPLLLDVIVLSWRRRGRGTVEPRRRELAGSVLVVSLLAAHPRSQQHASQLLAQLMPHLGPRTWLLANAATADLAGHYTAVYNFTPYNSSHPQLLERAPGPWHPPSR